MISVLPIFQYKSNSLKAVDTCVSVKIVCISENLFIVMGI